MAKMRTQVKGKSQRRKVGARTYEGQLEIHADRGVIYFHVTDPEKVKELGSVTLLRICNLPRPIPEQPIDITHMVGVDYLGELPGEKEEYLPR